MMSSLALLGLLGLANSAALSKAPICGPVVSDKCANVTLATQQPYARYQDNSTHYSWKQCSDTCQSNPECKSFSYYYGGQENNEAQANNVICMQFSLPISKYEVPCSEDSTTSLFTFYDKSCRKPQRNTTGDIPSTCDDSYCYPSGAMNNTKFASDQVGKPFFGLSNTDCRNKCLATKDCKSFLWEYFISEDSKDFGGPDIGGKSNPSSCLLLSQPAQFMLQDGGAFSSTPLYDLKCPDTQYGYLEKAPFCPDGKEAHSSV